MSEKCTLQHVLSLPVSVLMYVHGQTEGYKYAKNVDRLHVCILHFDSPCLIFCSKHFLLLQGFSVQKEEWRESGGFRFQGAAGREFLLL